MKIEQFEPMLANVKKRRIFPACDDAEAVWGNFLVSLRYPPKNKQPLRQIDITSENGQKVKAWVIQKTLGPETFLVLDPYPGLICTNHGRIIRPLMEVPKGFHQWFTTLKMSLEVIYSIDTYKPNWYVQGMGNLLQDSIEAEVDINGFGETLQEYEKICNVSF